MTININGNVDTIIINSDIEKPEDNDSKKSNIIIPDKAQVKQEIRSFVSHLGIALNPEWSSTYKKFWDDVLNLDILPVTVYNPGKQQGTVFNRNLVANIIFYLSKKGAFKSPYIPSEMARLLTGSADSSVRAALSKAPTEELVFRLDRYFEKYSHSSQIMR